MNKGYIFRLNPTKEHTTALKQHGGATRWVWNHMLSANIEKYNQEKKFIFRFNMDHLITKLKKEKETEWLKEINSQVL